MKELSSMNNGNYILLNKGDDILLKCNNHFYEYKYSTIILDDSYIYELQEFGDCTARTFF